VTKPQAKANTFEEKAIEDGLKSTKGLIQTFLQTVKAYRLYEASHPMLSRFLERLKKDFDQHFEEFDVFPLQVREHQLLYQGKVVYENEDVRESLAFFFYKDGVRELRFFKGLEFREIIEFLIIVRKGDFVNRLEEDLVTLLWEKDFPHITFTNVDEFLEEGAKLVPATHEDLVRGLEYVSSEVESSGEKEQMETGESALAVEGEVKDILIPSQEKSAAQICQLSPDEAEEIKRQVQREKEPEYLDTLIDQLIEILLHLGEDMESYGNLISYFDQTVKSLLEQNTMEKALAIVRRVTGIMDSIALKDTQIHVIRNFETSCSLHLIKAMGKAMRDNEEIDQKPILEYLRTLDKRIIEPLCLLLDELESWKGRKVICDLLAELCRKDIQPLTRFLTGQHPTMVCDVLSILGNVRDPSTLKYVGSLMTHHDPKVREETLQLINHFGEKGRDLIQRFLKDPSPGIRAKASLMLAKMAKGRAVKPLMEIILSEDFYKRDYEEKASFFRALGETGAEEVIPVLQKIVKKRVWFKGEKWNEMRLCATNTLRMMRTSP
jgi:hypothetical protein